MPKQLHLRSAALGAALALTLSACSGAASPVADSTDTDAEHGYVAGAAELSEPQLSLVYASAEGETAVLNLLTEETEVLAASEPITALAGNGRHVVRSHADSVSVIDSGIWTVDHADHFHYYSAALREFDPIAAAGAVAISTSQLTIAGSGKTLVFGTDAASSGDLTELGAIETGEGVIAHLAGNVLVASEARIAAFAADGADVDSLDAVCTDPADAVVTRVGAVFSCAEGAVLVTADDAGELAAASFPYPAGAARALEFDQRVGRPSIAGVSTDGTGVWHLNSRSGAWTFVPTATPLATVSAVSDDADLLVGVDVEGRVTVLDLAGAVLGQSEPIVAVSVSDEAGSVRLIVDAQRAYVTGPLENTIFEIDYRDGARIARQFTTDFAPDFAEQVG